MQYLAYFFVQLLLTAENKQKYVRWNLDLQIYSVKDILQIMFQSKEDCSVRVWWAQNTSYFPTNYEPRKSVDEPTQGLFSQQV